MIKFILLWVAWPFICGLANRIRGGWLAYEIKKKFKYWGPLWALFFSCFIFSIPVLLSFKLVDSIIFLLLIYTGFILNRGLGITFLAGAYCNLWIFALCGLLLGFLNFISCRYNFRYKDYDGHEWKTSECADFLFGLIIGFTVIYDIK